MSDPKESIVSAEDLGEVLAMELEDAQCVLLFGSALTAYSGPESDVDVAVMYPHPLGLRERVALAARLETLLGRTVDLLDLREADPVVRYQVLAAAHPVVVRDRAAYVRLVERTLAEYFDLKLGRRPVEQALRNGAAR